MAIAQKPKRPPGDVATPDPMVFITGADHQQTGQISPPKSLLQNRALSCGTGLLGYGWRV
jgi:hypothetical protein